MGAGAIAFGLACTSTAGQAATVRISFDNPIFNGSGSDSVGIHFPNLVGTGSSSLSTSAGRFQGTATQLNGVAPSVFVDSLSDVYMYCYDLYQGISSGNSATYTVNFDGERARTLDFLGAVNAVLNEGAASYDRHAWLHPVNGWQGAAIQLGIWESKYETSPLWDIGSGSFWATGLEAGSPGSPRTNEWLSRFFARIDHSDALHGQWVMTLDSATVQDMITGDPPGTVALPGTLSLLWPALVALGVVTRRRRANR